MPLRNNMVFEIAYFEYGFETLGAMFRLADPCVPQKLMAVHLLLLEGEIIWSLSLLPLKFRLFWTWRQISPF